MRKIKEVLRLRFELGLGQRQIARSCGMGLGTVHDYLERAAGGRHRLAVARRLGEEELEAKLFGTQPVPPKRRGSGRSRTGKRIHEQLQQHRHLTLQLLWEEYRQAHPDGYRYSRFCERYQHWRRKLDVVLRQEHKAGEKLFVDWAGATIPVYDTHDRAASAGIAVRRCAGSQFLHLCGSDSRSADGRPGSRRTSTRLEFYGGAPTLMVPDNTKTGVTRACRYDPDLNPDLSGDGDALRRGRGAGASLQAAR